MRWPLDSVYITGKFKEPAVAGTGLKDALGVARHIGLDLRAQSPKPVYAPGTGVVTDSYKSASGNQVIEMRINGLLWRFQHLSERLFLTKGAKVTEGTKIGMSGNTGGVPYHLHFDVRKDGTAWNSNLSNYYDPETFFKEEDEVLTKEDLPYIKMIHTELMGWPFNEVHGSTKYDKQLLDYWVGKTYGELLDYAWKAGEAYRADKVKAFAASNPDVTVNGTKYEPKK